MWSLCFVLICVIMLQCRVEFYGKKNNHWRGFPNYREWRVRIVVFFFKCHLKNSSQIQQKKINADFFSASQQVSTYLFWQRSSIKDDPCYFKTGSYPSSNGTSTKANAIHASSQFWRIIYTHVCNYVYTSCMPRRNEYNFACHFIQTVFL